MRFDTRLKVVAVCAVMAVSNFVLATENRVERKPNSAQALHSKRVVSKPAEAADSDAVQRIEIAPSEMSKPNIKPKIPPIEESVPPLELKSVRG